MAIPSPATLINPSRTRVEAFQFLLTWWSPGNEAGGGGEHLKAPTPHPAPGLLLPIPKGQAESWFLLLLNQGPPL